MRAAICTTVYNDMPVWQRCIDSIVPQLRPDLTWVVHDAASTDGSWEAAQAAALKANGHMGLCRNSSGEKPLRVNRGTGRHMAARHAISEFDPEVLVCSVDGDVIYRPGAFNLILKTFIEEGEGPIAGDSFFIISRDHYEEVKGYNKNLQIEEDFDIYKRLKAIGIGVMTRRLNVWEIDMQEKNPLHNIAPMGSDLDKTEPIEKVKA